jgi:hypothetical protein
MQGLYEAYFRLTSSIHLLLQEHLAIEFIYLDHKVHFDKNVLHFCNHFVHHKHMGAHVIDTSLGKL